MTPRPGYATAVLALSGLLLGGGCDSGGPGDPSASPAPQAEPALTSERPHFRGKRPVSLAVGLPSVGEEGCEADTAPEWVCDPDKRSTFLVLEDKRRATLLEARMDVADGGTSWTVTLRFDRAGRRGLAEVRERARASGAMVLVLDEADELLLSASVPHAEEGAIALTQLAKPEAWNTVERLAAE